MTSQKAKPEAGAKKTPDDQRSDVYELSVQENQVEVLMAALDLYMRIGMGQYREILEFSSFRYDAASPDPERYKAGRKEAGAMLDRVKILMTGLQPGSHLSIGSQEMADRYRTARDLRDVMRHSLSWGKNPNGGWTPNFAPPLTTIWLIPWL